MGYSDKVFIRVPDDYWRCPICAEILTDAVSVYCCDSVFCHECLSTWLVEQKKTTCPQCRKPLTEANAETRDQRTNKYIGTQMVYCANREDGCNWTGHLMDMTRHLTTDCPVLMVECPYQAIGCEKMMRRSELEHHLEDCMSSHLKMSMDTITTMKKEMNQLNTLCTQVIEPQMAVIKKSVYLEEDEVYEDSPMCTRIFRFKEESFLRKNCINSDSFECGGVKWRLQIWPRGDRDNQRDMPSVYIVCEFPFDSNSFHFVIRITFQFQLRHKDDPSKNITTESKPLFEYMFNLCRNFI
jgi:hypothetical protein